MPSKLLKPGERFYSQTKRMRKIRRELCKGNKPGIYVLRAGHVGYFEKGKRKYLCKVEGVVETNTGLWRGTIWTGEHNLNGKISGRRWWQFTYLVTVIEN
jgi:hypothetical protein